MRTELRKVPTMSFYLAPENVTEIFVTIYKNNKTTVCGEIEKQYTNM